MKALFSIDVSGLPEMKFHMNDSQVPDWERPFLRKSSEAFYLWASDPKMQKSLTALGSQYKTKNNDEAAPNGRSQYPIEAANGLESTEALIRTKNISPAQTVDISSIAGGESFQKAAWMFGYTPEMTHDGLAPNCGAMMRWLAFGAFHCAAINTLQMVGFMRDEKKDEEYMPTLEELQAFIDNLSSDLLARMNSAGVQICRADVEKAAPNHPWIYGGRKSYMTCSDADQMHSSLLITLYSTSGKGVARI